METSSPDNVGRPVFVRFDLRSLIAITTVAAGVSALCGSDFWLGIGVAISIAVPSITLAWLGDQAHPMRLRIILFGAFAGVVGLLIGYGVRLLWFDVLSTSARSDRYVTLVENLPLLTGSLVGALLGSVATISIVWRKRVRNCVVLALLLAVIGVGFLFLRSSSERWAFAHQVSTYQAIRGEEMPKIAYVHEWLRRFVGVSMQLDLTIDEHWPRDEYGRVAGLRDARFLQVRDIELSRKDLELLSNMPGVTDVVFDNATLPEGDLANLNVGTLQYWRCDVGQPEIDKILSQRNIDCLGLHDVELKASLFESFSRLPKLQSLLLSKTDLSDLDISKCKALTWMRLSNSELDDDGIAKLAGQNTERLKSVASSVIVGLSLAGNPITDTCVDDLLKFASVTDLDVTGTKLSAAGIRKLRAAMPLSKIHADEDVWTEAVYGPVE